MFSCCKKFAISCTFGNRMVELSKSNMKGKLCAHGGGRVERHKIDLNCSR